MVSERLSSVGNKMVDSFDRTILLLDEMNRKHDLVMMMMMTALVEGWSLSTEEQTQLDTHFSHREASVSEEEMVVSEISTSLSSIGVSTPWSGIVANSYHKALSETLQDSTTTELILGKSDSSSKQKSQLHDLFWETNLIKSSENEMQISDATSSLPPVSIGCSHIESVDDDNFIEA